MKERSIAFLYDDAASVERKIKLLTDIVGKNNISIEGLSYNSHQVCIRCNKKKWREVKFKLDLEKTYY